MTSPQEESGDVHAAAPMGRRGPACSGARRADGRRRVAKSPMTSVAARGGVNGRRSAIVAEVWRRRRTIRSRGGTSATGRRAAVPAAALLVLMRWLATCGGRCCRSVGGRRRATATDRPSVPRAAGMKSSPTAWAGGATSWRQRTALLQWRRQVGGDALRVVAEYQCLCSEYRSNAVTHNYFDGSGMFK